MTNWRNATCEKCKYRVEDACRRFPPQRGSTLSGFYPLVLGDGGFAFACAEYAEEPGPCGVCHGTKKVSMTSNVSGAEYECPCLACC